MTYFQAMSATPLLTPQQEIELAEELEARELNLWTELLSFPPVVDHLLRLIEARLEAPLPAFRTLRAAVTRAKKARKKAVLESLERAAGKTGIALRERDPDGEILDAALQEVSHIRRTGRGLHATGPLGFSASARGFMSYIARVSARKQAALASRNRFVRANLGLVVSVARRYQHSGMPLADLIQEGNLGLLKAVARFDASRGFRFSTYATWWIRHAIGRAVADKSRTVRVPVHVLEARQRINKLRRELVSSLARDPTESELAEAASMDVDRLRDVLSHAGSHEVSLDEQLGDDSDRDRLEVFRDPEDEDPSPFERVAITSILGRVRHILGTLPPLEREVLERRFGLVGEDEVTLQRIAESHGLSRERIRQIQERALGKVRQSLQQEHAI
jgi:RNA polymerase primary sigma factor